MVRVKNYSVRKCSPSPPAEVGLSFRRAMLIAEGYFYHVKDSFFILANDSMLMSNYENGGYRPHFFAIRDIDNADIFWMVPVSSQYQKFSALYQKMSAKYGRCTKIVLGKCGGKDAAFFDTKCFSNHK